MVNNDKPIFPNYKYIKYPIVLLIKSLKLDNLYAIILAIPHSVAILVL